MNFIGYPFMTPDQKKEYFFLRSRRGLTTDQAPELRQAIEACARQDYPVVYLDVKEVEEMDLAGINEVINAHYFLKQRSKKLIFLYKRNSIVEHWVNTAGLHKFVETALVA